jgi:hypothetical protein
VTNEDKPAAPRRRRLLRIAGVVLLGALLAWCFWPRPAQVEAPPAPGWPSPLDVLDPARLADDAWPRNVRPPEAVGVLDLSQDARRLEVSIAEGVVHIKNARGEEVVCIDAYAPPKPPKREAPKREGGLELPKFELEFKLPADWLPKDEHKVFVAALSPKADRLVVLGQTKHTPGRGFVEIRVPGESGPGESGPCDWAQVWRWEGDKLTPLEAQPLEGEGARAAAFSADGKLLATARKDGTDIWEVGDKELKHLGKIAGERKQLLFAPDGRSLAVVSSSSLALYDLGPILPGGSDWARWRFLSAALGLVAAVAVICSVLNASEVDRARRLRIATSTALLGVGACVAWWAWRPLPAGAPLAVGLGFGAALAVLLLLALERWRWRNDVARQDDVAVGFNLVTILGALICLGLWVFEFWWPSPSLLTPSPSDLARADVKAACFSADGRELAAVRDDGRLSLFDAASGRETHAWDMPAGVMQAEFAPDGRHLLGVAGNKAYVLRLKPFDDDAFVLNCCEEVLRQDPRAVDALLARGHVRLHRGELDEAVDDFTKVIDLDKNSAAAYHGRGLARTDKGDYAGARADFADALRLDPKLADAAPRGPNP